MCNLQQLKHRRFHVPQPTFLFPLETTPLRLSRNMLHGWKDNSVLAKRLAACTLICKHRILFPSIQYLAWLPQRRPKGKSNCQNRNIETVVSIYDTDRQLVYTKSDIQCYQQHPTVTLVWQRLGLCQLTNSDPTRRTRRRGRRSALLLFSVARRPDLKNTDNDDDDDEDREELPGFILSLFPEAYENVQFKNQDEPQNVVVKLIVAGESHQSTYAYTQRKEPLSCCISPRLYSIRHFIRPTSNNVVTTKYLLQVSHN